MRFFGRETAVSTNHVDREKELWDLVKGLQKEKADLCRERDMWREKYLNVTGQGNWTYPPPQEVGGELKEEADMEPLGKHVSIMGLRAKHEIAMRELAKKKDSEYKSPSIEGKRDSA